jgi:hypothetical protein
MSRIFAEENSKGGLNVERSDEPVVLIISMN